MSNFTIERFKSQLKLSISRLTYLQKKLTAQSLAARKEIADLLKINKTDQALTKVRYIVRDDFLVEAMEIVQSFCDDLLKSANLIATTDFCDEFIMEQAKSVIYASNRLDVPELLKVRDLLVSKYSKTILPQGDLGVYPRLVLKLSMSYPERRLCEKYLEAIAESFGVEWTAEESDSDSNEIITPSHSHPQPQPHQSPENSHLSSSHPPSPQPSSSRSSASISVDSLQQISSPPAYSEAFKSSAPLPMDYSKQSNHSYNTNTYTNNNTSTTNNNTNHSSTNNSTNNVSPANSRQNLPDFDEFTRRFEALRKK